MWYITYRDNRSRTGFGSTLASMDIVAEYIVTLDIISMEWRDMDSLPVFTPAVMAALSSPSPSL